MDPAAARALERLKQGAALEELARLVVEEATRTPLAEIATPRWLASQLATGLEAATSPTAREWLLGRLDGERSRWADREDTLREYLPEEVDEPLRELLSQPWSPDEELVFRIIDQAAIRDLMRHVLTNALMRFRKRVSSVDQTVLGGLGKRAARRGKGLLGGLNSVGGNISGMASGLVSGVKNEVEEGLDGKVREFARHAAEEQVRAAARYIADPLHADAFAQLRVSVLDVLLDTPMKEFASEVDKLGPGDAVKIVAHAVRGALDAEDFVDKAEERIALALDEVGDGSLGAWLEEAGLLEVWTTTTAELVAARLKAVVQTEAFEGWWSGLFEED